jgi:hypothetical protein
MNGTAAALLHVSDELDVDMLHGKKKICRDPVNKILLKCLIFKEEWLSPSKHVACTRMLPL